MEEIEGLAEELGADAILGASTVAFAALTLALKEYLSDEDRQSVTDVALSLIEIIDDQTSKGNYAAALGKQLLRLHMLPDPGLSPSSVKVD